MELIDNLTEEVEKLSARLDAAKSLLCDWTEAQGLGDTEALKECFSATVEFFRPPAQSVAPTPADCQNCATVRRVKEVQTANETLIEENRSLRSERMILKETLAERLETQRVEPAPPVAESLPQNGAEKTPLQRSARKPLPEKICPVCKKPFVPKLMEQITCSTQCRSRKGGAASTLRRRQTKTEEPAGSEELPQSPPPILNKTGTVP